MSWIKTKIQNSKRIKDCSSSKLTLFLWKRTPGGFQNVAYSKEPWKPGFTSVFQFAFGQLEFVPSHFALLPPSWLPANPCTDLQVPCLWLWKPSCPDSPRFQDVRLPSWPTGALLRWPVRTAAASAPARQVPGFPQAKLPSCGSQSLVLNREVLKQLILWLVIRGADSLLKNAVFSSPHSFILCLFGAGAQIFQNTLRCLGKVGKERERELRCVCSAHQGWQMLPCVFPSLPCAYANLHLAAAAWKGGHLLKKKILGLDFSSFKQWVLGRCSVLLHTLSWWIWEVLQHCFCSCSL